MENLENIKEEELKDVDTKFEKIQDKVDENVSSEFKKDIEDVTASSDYVKQDEDDDKEEEQEKEEEKASEETQDSSEQKDNKEDDDDEDKEKKKYQLLQEKFTELENSYSLLKEQYQSLVAFKTQIDNQKKDELIAEFYMLSEDDKKDVLQNKEKYTLDEIKAKLSVICFDKKINFSTEEKVEPEKEVFTYNTIEEADTLPDWVRLVKEQERMN